jgi:aminomethyltransferase
MKRTPLYDVYQAYEGVKLIDFGGWELPVNFAGGILSEHEVVRTKVGLFDVSHMGECLVEGENAAQYLDYLCTNTISSLLPNQILYTMMCYPNGTVVDDLLVYCRDENHYLVVLNASNIEKDMAWIMEGNPKAHLRPIVTNCSSETAQLALQGPLAVKTLQKLLPDCENILTFTFREDCLIEGLKVLVSRTGYTGEDGFELYCDAVDGPALWNILLEAGKEFEIAPCGLGARDTLRMESKLPLYGHEISDSITPLEANLGVFVHLEKPDFCGKEALAKQKEEGIPRTLRGVEMIDKSVPRSQCKVFLNEREVGFVTSGTKSPTLQKFCAYVMIERVPALKFGDVLEIEIHGQRKKAKLVKTPFYKHGKSNEQQ